MAMSNSSDEFLRDANHHLTVVQDALRGHEATPTRVAAYTTLVFVAIYIASLVVYRVHFHPLARFPGPFLAKITDLYSVWHNLKGQSHLETFHAHQKYGAIVRWGPNKLSISSVTAIQKAYRSGAISKSQVFATITPTPGAFSTFTAIDKSLHRRKRKVFSQAFSDAALRDFAPIMEHQADIFVGQIQKHIQSNGLEKVWSQPLNMTPISRYYATDVMGEFGFGKSFDVQTDDANKFLLKATDGATVVAGMYCQYPKLQRYGIGSLVALAGMTTKAQFGQLARSLIDQRLQEPNEKKRDLLHFVSSAKETRSGVDFTMDEVWAESRFVLIAGAETTGTAISASLFYLSRHPIQYQRLSASIRSIFTSNTDICLGSKLDGCEYLWACVDEAMRLSPSVVAVLWREVCTDDFSIDDEYIPKGTDLGTSVYCPHHDDSIFSQPFKFSPERWLETEDTQPRIQQQRLAFNPFGLGTRKCIGLKMAYAEIGLALAKSLWAMDLKLPDDPSMHIGGGKQGAANGRHREGEFQLYEHITTRHDGPYLQWAMRGQEAY